MASNKSGQNHKSLEAQADKAARDILAGHKQFQPSRHEEKIMDAARNTIPKQN